jgi:hypothetical protein
LDSLKKQYAKKGDKQTSSAGLKRKLQEQEQPDHDKNNFLLANNNASIISKLLSSGILNQVLLQKQNAVASNTQAGKPKPDTETDKYKNYSDIIKAYASSLNGDASRMNDAAAAAMADELYKSLCKKPREVEPNEAATFESSNGGEAKTRKSKSLPELATKIMKDWFEAHSVHPYPSDEERREMAAKGDINESQVKAWFANRRNRTSSTKSKKKSPLKATSEENVSQTSTLNEAEPNRPLQMEEAGKEMDLGSKKPVSEVESGLQNENSSEASVVDDKKANKRARKPRKTFKAKLDSLSASDMILNERIG